MIESIIKIDLPENVKELILKIKLFQDSTRANKKNTEWFNYCVNNKSIKNLKSIEIDSGLNRVELASVAAKAYSSLIEDFNNGLPHCVSSDIIKTSSAAKKLLDALPDNRLLPGLARDQAFINGLVDAANWKPSCNNKTLSKYGNPAVRYLIFKIANEFCYSFAKKPTVGIIGDLVRIGWPDKDDRSIRNTATNEFLVKALNDATSRRDLENQATSFTHRVISSQTSKATRETKEVSILTKLLDDESKLAEMEKIAKSLNDQNSSTRMISIINAIRYEHGYPQKN